MIRIAYSPTFCSVAAECGLLVSCRLLKTALHYCRQEFPGRELIIVSQAPERALVTCPTTGRLYLGVLHISTFDDGTVIGQARCACCKADMLPNEQSTEANPQIHGYYQYDGSWLTPAEYSLAITQQETHE